MKEAEQRFLSIFGYELVELPELDGSAGPEVVGQPAVEASQPSSSQAAKRAKKDNEDAPAAAAVAKKPRAKAAVTSGDYALRTKVCFKYLLSLLLLVIYYYYLLLFLVIILLLYYFLSYYDYYCYFY
jgi:hypothetical protein